MTVRPDKQTVDAWRQRIEFGTASFSRDELRQLFYLATGECIPKRKRCESCNAAGCSCCNGTGYDVISEVPSDAP